VPDFKKMQHVKGSGAKKIPNIVPKEYPDEKPEEPYVPGPQMIGYRDLNSLKSPSSPVDNGNYTDILNGAKPVVQGLGDSSED